MRLATSTAASTTATTDRGDGHDGGEAATARIMTAALSCMTPGVTAGHEVLARATREDRHAAADVMRWQVSCGGRCHAVLALWEIEEKGLGMRAMEGGWNGWRKERCRERE